ncbi:MAG: DUF1259 domain-containing protein [Elusimicrobia bacterium]|nr:DUF1259 domain-containing protein [Elusimicrobiota bacterium]
MTSSLALALFLGAAPAVAASRAADVKLDTARIEAETGLKGTLDKKDGVFKVVYPRADIKETVAGVRITPAMGLTAWAAFTTTGRRALVMGDIVLLENQVNPVMSAALDHGLEVTALHNHFLWDSPRVMFMHIGGAGDQETLARGVGAVFAELKKTIGAAGPTVQADIDPSRTSLDPAKLDAALGAKGRLAHGVYTIAFGLKTKIDGRELGGAMGVHTAATFVGSEEKAVVDGDFAVRQGRLQNVLRALRHAGIDVVAIHNHMIMESPRVMFLHFWGVGKASALAAGLRTALDSARERQP